MGRPKKNTAKQTPVEAKVKVTGNVSLDRDLFAELVCELKKSNLLKVAELKSQAIDVDPDLLLQNHLKKHLKKPKGGK